MNLAARPWIAAVILGFLTGCSDSPEQRLINEFLGYKAMAEKGDSHAQNELAKKFYTGEGVKMDQVQAAFWYQKAAKQGYAPAQNSLAFCYMFGTGVAKNEFHAIFLYQAAAEQGYAPAQSALGVCYALGWGVAKDEIEAYALHSLARTEDASLKWLATLQKKCRQARLSPGRSALRNYRKKSKRRLRRRRRASSLPAKWTRRRRAPT